MTLIGGEGEMMAEHPNVDAARTALEAFMKGDVETMTAGIDEEAVWHVPGSHRWAGTFSGRTAIVDRAAKMAEEGYESAIEEIHDIVGNDEHVVALVRLSVTAPSGSTSTNSVWVMHARGGTTTEFWAYNEDQAAIDALMG